MSSIVTDTHALIWYIFDLNRLSDNALSAFEQAVNTGNPIYVSAISIVEIAYLVERRRFVEEVLTRILNALDDPNIGIVLAPLDRKISEAVRQIDQAKVPDMPDS